jgi:hypothetical protein
MAGTPPEGLMVRGLIAGWLRHEAAGLRADYLLFEAVADALDRAAEGIESGRLPPADTPRG